MSLLVGLPEMVFEGRGGAYYHWSSSNMPVLGQTKVGACKIVLQPKGFALPHFADSTKIAFVLQGSGDGLAGLVSPDSNKETVVRLKKGARFTIEKGVVSWWYNAGDSLLEVVFLGETVDAMVPGQFTYLFLSGANSLLRGFTAEFISKLYNMTENEANELATSQTGMIIVKLDKNGPIDHITTVAKQDCFNYGDKAAKLEMVDGGPIKTFTVPGAELSAFDIELQPRAGFPPMYMASPAVQVSYVVKGSCWLQIVNVSGELELNEHVEAGHLFVVPKFYTVALVAGEEGLECFSVITTSKLVLGQLSNVWSALAPSGALQAALNLKADKAALVSKIGKDLTISSNEL